MDIEMIMTLYSITETLNPLGLWATILIEGSALVFLWRKRMFKTAIGRFIILHMMVFTATGLAFWKWIIMDTAFLLAVLRIDTDVSGTFFNKRTIAVVTVLILLSAYLFSISSLAWYTTNYDRRYSVEVVSENGTVYEMHHSEIDLYALTFGGTAQFDYLHNDIVIDSHTMKNYQLAEQSAGVRNHSDVEEIEQQFGQSRYDPERTETFDRFVRRYFKTRLEEPNKGFVWFQVTSPPHLYNTVETTTSPPGVEYSHFRVRMEKIFMTDGKLDIINSTVVRQVAIDDD